MPDNPSTLKATLVTFNEKWERLVQTLQDHKITIDFAERKNIFIISMEKITIVLYEIIVYIDQACEDCKDHPTDFLIKIELKMKELEDCKSSLLRLCSECHEITEPTLKISIETELQCVQEKSGQR